MSYGLETIGGLVGGMAEGGWGLVQGVAVGGAVGAGTGAVAGAAAGAVLGAPTGLGEVIAIPSGAAGGAVIGGVGGAVIGGGYGAVTGAQQGVQDGRDWGRWLSEKIDGAQEKAKAKPKTEADTDCKGCMDNPCANLAKGLPGSKYRGGAHGMMTQPSRDGLESHHTPAAAASSLPRNLGPAIQMEPADHLQTASQSRQPGYLSYISAQKGFVGGGDFMGAIGMDIVDIHSKFGSKYDSALDQMSA